MKYECGGKRGHVTTESRGGLADEKADETKERIYQNSRGHSTSGIVGEIVTLSPGFGSISLEVLRGRRAHLMGHGFLGLWGGSGAHRETERIIGKMNICSRSESKREIRDGQS